ncbi:hypothetical protein Dsin_013302 [Dipteronia sinensis]|uniref:Uncharacterized protein n=1 Tax=Dipteronia sinensis TaxID=43782 RepID=A0AAE0AJT3_9ROSI|nr:hypothetical protein Dsin_013302 [Dipteronia sinensis]
MDIDSFCGRTPDQIADNHDHQQQQQQHDLLGQPPMLLDPEFVWLNSTSSDCWSAAASKALSLDCGPAVSETVSLTEERSRNHDHVQELHNQWEHNHRSTTFQGGSSSNQNFQSSDHQSQSEMMINVAAAASANNSSTVDVDFPFGNNAAHEFVQHESIFDNFGFFL